MFNWLWNLLKPKSSVYEVTGVLRASTVVLRYWKTAESKDGNRERDAVHDAVVRVIPPTRGDYLGLRRYANAVSSVADLNALEVLWADDEDRRGVVIYRDWP